MNRKAVLVLALVAASLFLGGCRAPVMTHDVRTEAKPWTSLDFRNDPADFHFAIVSDNTGGARPGVFADAMTKLNLLQPEFVISVGDFIEGYTEKDDILAAERADFDKMVKSLEMPFFYVPGNHDVTNRLMAREWERRYGRRYYSFVYKNVLFLCLDSQDKEDNRGNGRTVQGLSADQLAWAQRTLRANDHVRWTFVFLHQPLWLYGEKTVARAEFAELQKALVSRKYSVFAGHYHRYAKYVRDGHNYIVLATTGAGSSLAGPMEGEFDEVAWITMTPQGPRMANIALDGILDENVLTEDTMKFARGARFRAAKVSSSPDEFTMVLPLENSFDGPMLFRVSWPESSASAWKVSPAAAEARTAPGEKTGLEFTAKCSGTPFPLPQCMTELYVGDRLRLKARSVPTDAYLQAHRPELRVRRAAQAPALDGRLDDAAWQHAPDAQRFANISNFAASKAATDAWTCYDEQNLYFAFRCAEPEMDKLRVAHKSGDILIWVDDGIEIIFSLGGDRKSGFHLMVNADGQVYQERDGQKVSNITVRAAAARSGGGWSMEAAIPWSALGFPAPSPEVKMGFVLVRDRPHARETLQFPYLNGGNHNSENYGLLTLAP